MTIAVCARNAAETIERAIASILPETLHARLLLIDDHCTDNTVALARSEAGARLQVITVTHPVGGLARARQTAVDAVDTDYLAWMDADDEWIPGRAERLSNALSSGFDVAYEPLDLWDGPSDRFLRKLEFRPS